MMCYFWGLHRWLFFCLQEHTPHNMCIHNGDMQTSKMQGEPGAWPLVITKIACATLKCKHTHAQTQMLIHCIFPSCSLIWGQMPQRKKKHPAWASYNTSSMTNLSPCQHNAMESQYQRQKEKYSSWSAIIVWNVGLQLTFVFIIDSAAD